MNNVNFEEKEEITVVDILKFLIKNSPTILIMTTSFFILGILYAVLKPKTYVGESGLLIVDTKPEVSLEPKIQMKELTEYLKNLENKKQGISELIKSPMILNEVINEALKQGIIKEEELKRYKISLKKKIEISQAGNIVKIKVRISDPQQAKFFADEIAKKIVEKSSFFVTDNISIEVLKQKLIESRREYENSVRRYNEFLKNNKILDLTKKIDQLQEMYDYYKNNIVEIEKNIWQAKNLKEQLKSGGITNIGELADSLALLKFKSSIFSRGSDLPLKLEINQSNNVKLDKIDVDSVVKEIDTIISILEERKKEFEEELSSKNYEKQIQQLRSELDKEKNREKDLIKDKDLNWESVVTLERKIKEVEISNGIAENILVKIAYLSDLPDAPENGKGKLIVLVFTILGVFLGILISGFREIYIKIKD